MRLMVGGFGCEDVTDEVIVEVLGDGVIPSRHNFVKSQHVCYSCELPFADLLRVV